MVLKLGSRGSLVLSRASSAIGAQGALNKAHRLASWKVDEFKREALIPARPAVFAHEVVRLPPACRKWFMWDGQSECDFVSNGPPHKASLNKSFWNEYESMTVPLELTTHSPTDPRDVTFHRSEGPFKLLLEEASSTANHSLYLAQCPLPSLPEALQADLPTPEVILKAGRGDIYDSSLWIGRPPTYTPLHRDPNPNLLMQLAGRKVVRLFPPEVGLAIFERVQERIGQCSSSVFRGEEMMQGAEKELLEREVWDDGDPADLEAAALRRQGVQAEIDLGEALFIPKGWWHSVRGVGEGVTASVNWWFR